MGRWWTLIARHYLSEPSVTWMQKPVPSGYWLTRIKTGGRILESSDYESVQIFIAVDVGKDTHHAVAINRSGNLIFYKTLPNDKKFRAWIFNLNQHGRYCWLLTSPQLSEPYRCSCSLRRHPRRKPSRSDNTPHRRFTHRWSQNRCTRCGHHSRRSPIRCLIRSAHWN